MTYKPKFKASLQWCKISLINLTKCFRTVGSAMKTLGKQGK